MKRSYMIDLITNILLVHRKEDISDKYLANLILADMEEEGMSPPEYTKERKSGIFSGKYIRHTHKWRKEDETK